MKTLLFLVSFSLKSLLSSFTYAQNVADKLCGEYLMKCFKKGGPVVRFWYFLLR